MKRLAPAALVTAIVASSCGGNSPSSAQPPERVAAHENPRVQGPSAEQQVVEKLAALRFDELGSPVIRWDAIPPVRASKDQPHRLLVVLVEFSDLGFERFRGDKQQGEKLAGWYQEQLFDDSYAKKNTLSHYYKVQSGGAYHITGKVLPPIRLPEKRAAYGSAHRPAGGTWRNDIDPDTMVEQALKLVSKQHSDLDWSEYDRWDPGDFDGDDVTDEPDGYLDHFVLVFAGGGQSSCQLLNEIGQILTPNVGNEALKKLDRRQRECADRLWPHRDALRRRESQGPTVGGVMNARGGLPLSEDLWAYDYNMQSEYTAAATFIHEFGHSIGLPDVYARTSSNSTGPWEVMSATADPSPQNLSAWSRMQLGWLKPRVVRPPAHGGAASAAVHLALADDGDAEADRAAMVILPPKKKMIELTELPESSGQRALYSGQGNEMNRRAELALDLTRARSARISMDAWWDIEAGWDFAYIEASEDGGSSWARLAPVDPQHMPAKHGHDGKDSKPGLTGLSGDLDGDGKNESHPECDPAVEIKHGEDSAGAEKSKCLSPTWVRIAFDLAPYRGKKDVRFRIRYYTDAAAVKRGLLIDNVAISGDGAPALATDFEGSARGWKLDGFSPSPGRHELLVPHYYLLEYRDPYRDPGYDSTLAEPSYSFYWAAEDQRVMAMASRVQPGVVAWYYDGAFAWSENDPAINGPGRGYLLALDSMPEEIPLPGLESLLSGEPGSFQTHYQTDGKGAQALLEDAYHRTICFIRDSRYMPRKHEGSRAQGCRRGRKAGPVEKIRIDGKKAMYSYKVIGDFLPGERDELMKVGELIDVKRTKKGPVYRLRDRTLRHLHTYDAPFSASGFERGRILYRVTKTGKLVEDGAIAYPAQPSFRDDEPARWLNPKLPFGGTAVPQVGFGFTVKKPAAAAPAGTAATVELSWSSPATQPAPPAAAAQKP